MDSPAIRTTMTLERLGFVALLVIAGLRAVISTYALANARPVALVNLGLALIAAILLVLSRTSAPSPRVSAWSRRLAALAAIAILSIEGLILYPRFIGIDVWIAALLVSGIIALVVATTLTFRIDRVTEVVAMVSATVAGGALCDAISESIALSWIAPMAVVATIISTSRLLFGLQKAQREMLEAHRRQAELSAQLALASAEILDSRHRESLSLIASGISHEINNPLTYLRGNLELLTEELETCSPETLELLSGVSAGIDAIAGVVERIRSIFKGVLAPSQTVNLYETVRTAIGSLSHSADRYTSISNRVAPDIIVDAHPADVYIVSTNLLRNAVDATCDNERASASVECIVEERTVALIVEDTGSGMSRSQIDRCFDPFYTTKAEGGGMGIGLALCKAIADRTGSTLEITSTPGVGTRVRYVMKRAET